MKKMNGYIYICFKSHHYTGVVTCPALYTSEKRPTKVYLNLRCCYFILISLMMRRRSGGGDISDLIQVCFYPSGTALSIR